MNFSKIGNFCLYNRQPNLVLSFLILVLFGSSLTAQKLHFEDPKLPNTPISFCYHYGDEILVSETYHTGPQGKFNIKLPENSGIYYLVSADSILIEFIYDVSIKEDISVIKQANKLNYTVASPMYSQLYYGFIGEMQNLKSRLELDSIIDQYIAKSNSPYLTRLLRAQRSIDMSGFDSGEPDGNAKLSTFEKKMRYYQQHYLDNLEIDNPDLIFSPIYTLKINEFLDRITQQKPEFLVKAIDFVVEKSKTNSTTHKFICKYLLNKYKSKSHKALEEYCYVHLIGSHFLSLNEDWVSEEFKQQLTLEYDRHFPASLLQKSPNLSGQKTSGKLDYIHNTDAELIILYFYNYDCPICNELTAAIKKVMWKYDYLKLQTIAYCVGENREKWLEYIGKQGINKWKNLWIDENHQQFSLFNISFTPTLFLLDKDKNIINKNLNANQLNKIIANIAIGNHK